MRHDARGVSSVLGVTLLFGMVLVGMFVVVVVGGTALDETRNGLDTERAEKTMTQFDSRSAMVALGSTSRQGVELAVGDNDEYRVAPEAGWMNVTLYNSTADDHTELTNETLGAVVYENGDVRVAYQGGGVWKRSNSGASMLSPPEFHFRDATLTLPIITVDGSRSLGGNAHVTRADKTRVYYPNASEDANFTNPMDDGHVNVTVHSEYYEAWGKYFEQRSDGDVSYDHDEEITRIKLVVPFNESYDHVLVTTETGTDAVDVNPGPPPEHETGVPYPLVDSRIENNIQNCESGGCTTISGSATITSGGTYYRDGDFTGLLEITDPTSDDVTVVVNGAFEPSDVKILSSSDHNTTILVKNSETNGVKFSGNAEINRNPGDPSDLEVLVHSNVEIAKSNGAYLFGGLLYAPGSECRLDGGGAGAGGGGGGGGVGGGVGGGGSGGTATIKGALVCESFDANGKPHAYEYDPGVNDIRLGLSGDVTPITFLHVTKNPVNVTSN